MQLVQKVPVAQLIEKKDWPPPSESFIDTRCQDVLMIEKMESILVIIYPGLLECSADETQSTMRYTVT